MSAANTVRRLVAMKQVARHHWLDLMEKVQEIGDGPFAVVREAEREMNAAGRREVALARRAIRSIIALARESGIEFSSDIPLAISSPMGLFVVHQDPHDDEVKLVVVPPARVVNGGSL